MTTAADRGPGSDEVEVEVEAEVELALERDGVVAWLRECDGPWAGRVHPLVAGVHVVGRAREASVVLSDCDVSRRHARLQVAEDGLWLEDLDSKNGVFLDGTTPVEGPVFLDHGQRFQVGGVTLEVSHPDSRVLKALEQAGDFTMTRYTASRARARGDARGREGRSRDLVIPLAATVMFAVLSALLWLQG